MRIDAGNMTFSGAFNLLGNASVLGLPITALSNANLDVATASLDGILQLDFAFAPSVGQVITVFTYDSHTGEFDSIVGAGLATGFVFTPIYNSDNFQVGIAAIPEPETYVLMLPGLCLVLVVKRRAAVRQSAA